MTTYTTPESILEVVREAGLLREVKKAKIQIAAGKVIPNRQAVIYADTKEYIATVGSTYRLISNEETILPFATALIESNMDLTGMVFKASQNKAQSRSLMTFILPSYEVATSKNDTTQLQFVLRNSYDGSWKFQLDAGGFRLACANGQVIGDYMNMFNNMHTSGFTITSMVDRLHHAINVFSDMGRYWLELQDIKLSSDDAMKHILTFLGKAPKTMAEQLAMLSSSRAKSIIKIVALYEKYVAELGDNAFALYNTMTDYASHNNTAADYQADFSDRITTIMPRILNERTI
jgi:hypothetical protein